MLDGLRALNSELVTVKWCRVHLMVSDQRFRVYSSGLACKVQVVWIGAYRFRFRVQGIWYRVYSTGYTI